MCGDGTEAVLTACRFLWLEFLLSSLPAPKLLCPVLVTARVGNPKFILANIHKCHCGKTVLDSREKKDFAVNSLAILTNLIFITGGDESYCSIIKKKSQDLFMLHEIV